MKGLFLNSYKLCPINTIIKNMNIVSKIVAWIILIGIITVLTLILMLIPFLILGSILFVSGHFIHKFW